MLSKIFLYFMFFLVLIPSVYALNMTSNLGTGQVLTNCPYNLTQAVWYDICASPCTDAEVYYNITNETIPDNSKTYPSTQTLVHVGGSDSPLYEKTGIIAPWWNDTYYAAVQISRSGYDTIYRNTTFVVVPDYPSPDYPAPKNGKFVYSAYLGYFNIWVKAFYNPETCTQIRPYKLTCLFNDIPKDTLCPNDFNGGMEPGKEYTAACTISSPNYDFGNSPSGTENNISCKFFDPVHPWLISWHTEKFKPIAFDVIVSPPSKISVGEPLTLQITVVNNGLLTDNYTINVTSATPSIFQITNGNTRIENLKNSETASAYVSAIPLLSGSSQIEINVTSETSCKQKCITWSKTFTISTNVVNLPGINTIEILQMLSLAIILFMFGLERIFKT